MPFRFSGSYLAVGPSSFRVVDGVVEVLGYTLGVGGSFVVPVGRSVPVRVDGVVNVLPGSSVLKPMDSRDYDRLDTIASELSRYDRVVLVGPVDSGKSTLALWVSNKMFLRGLKVEYLTVDVGQNEVFCPAFEALATINPPGIPGYSGSFSSVKPCFIGSFTPSDTLDKYLKCASKLSSAARDPLIVDTDGWVSPPEGLESKARLSIIVKASIIVAIGLGEGEVKLLKELTGIETLNLPRLVRGSKSSEERRLHRERLLAQKLSGSRPRHVRVGEVIVEGAQIFKGSPIDKTVVKTIAPNIVYAEKTDGGGIIAVYRGRPPANLEATIPLGWEKGLIAAVHGEDVHVGVVDKINYETRTITVLTPYKGPIKVIEVGKTRVDVENLIGKAKW